MIDFTPTDFPEPLSPTIPRDSPFIQRIGNPIHCMNNTVLRVESRDKIFNFQQMCHIVATLLSN